MKTRIATLVLLIGVLITSTAFASEPVPASKAVATSVANLIQEELEYPEFAIEEKLEAVVVMEVSIDDDGSLEVLAANSLYSDMKEYVVESVENIETDDFAQYAGQTLLVKVKYDLKLY